MSLGKKQAEMKEKAEIYCRRLGHRVEFSYCAKETAGEPCRLVRDCWHEQIEIDAWLAKNCSDEVVQRLQTSKRPDKLKGLLELIEQAKASQAES